jgi:hypothetical protein
MTTTVTKKIPLALENLIRANNKLLKQYQEMLLTEIQEAALDSMQLLNLDPDVWQIDMQSMQFVRPLREDEMENSTISDPEYGTIA